MQTNKQVTIKNNILKMLIYTCQKRQNYRKNRNETQVY